MEQIAKLIYQTEPLNYQRKSGELNNQIDRLNNDQRLSLLLYSFKNYDKNYNKSLCLTYPNLWNSFTKNDWEKLILKMFPRKIIYLKDDLRDINTGYYFDIFLLNGIIGVSPFNFIFNSVEIKEEEKKELYIYLKHYGEVLFFYDERELIEDIVDFYDLSIFNDIVRMKDDLINTGVFEPTLDFKKLLDQLEN